MTTHVMIDLETWGKKPGCDIRSIGAVFFDPFTKNVGKCQYDDPFNPSYTFYRATEPCPLLKRDPSTVEWWSKQSEEAQSAFANPVPLNTALNDFKTWLADLESGNVGSSKLRIWANGPQFDCAILEAAIDAVGFDIDDFWYYRSPRDFRTIVELANITREEMKEFSHGVSHNALDDAISQAKIVCEAYGRLGL